MILSTAFGVEKCRWSARLPFLCLCVCMWIMKIEQALVVQHLRKRFYHLINHMNMQYDLFVKMVSSSFTKAINLTEQW